jgi:hypothetical protein
MYFTANEANTAFASSLDQQRPVLSGKNQLCALTICVCLFYHAYVCVACASACVCVCICDLACVCVCFLCLSMRMCKMCASTCACVYMRCVSQHAFMCVCVTYRAYVCPTGDIDIVMQWRSDWAPTNSIPGSVTLCS